MIPKNNCDIGVQLLYYLYAKKIAPSAVQHINHELQRESVVLYYLKSQGRDIMEVASALFEEKGDGA